MRLDEQEARRRFAGARVLRMATTTPAGVPHLVPATFALGPAGEVLIAVDAKPKRHTDLQRLRNLRADPAVSLLTDHYDDDWSQLWWVRADGRADVHDGGGHVDVGPLTAKYEQYRHRPPDGSVIVVRVERWQGWAFTGDRTD